MSMTIRVKNRVTGVVIDVPVERYESVLARQGIYLPTEENVENEEQAESEGPAGDSGEQEQAAHGAPSQGVRKRRGQKARKH